MFSKLRAFTLAEVLITLAVIGVVAALAIPSLVTNMNNMQYKSAWKKNYAEIASVARKMAYDNGGALDGYFTSQDAFMNAFKPYLSYTKTCVSGTTLSQNCWHADNTWYDLNGTKMVGSGAAYDSNATVVLTSGTIMSTQLNSSSCTGGGVPNNDNCGIIYFDINGYKGPNMVGKDIYAARLTKIGTLIPAGTQGGANFSSTSSCNTSNGINGWDCSAFNLYN